MDTPASHVVADTALADSIAVVERLHATCCEPGRSPRMEQLIATLAAARVTLSRGDDATAELAEAGAQVGWLEVACCSEKRLPLYTEILANLATAYRALDMHGH
ncbi:MAG TPA: hypothetical protein DCY40_08170 [Actinobacteria bacterium]|nr:hypothetical protein [Actinomycetota bacterium]